MCLRILAFRRLFFLFRRRNPHLKMGKKRSKKRFAGDIAPRGGNIKKVWCHNLNEEIQAIQQVVQTYNWIALDTEFPGVVTKPIGDSRYIEDYVYQKMRYNVDLTKVLQLGLTFMDENGNIPQGTCTWQFHFQFDMREDTYSPNAITFLTEHGLSLRRHKNKGISHLEFGRQLIASGILLMDNIHWLGFHSCYDFGYMLKLITNKKLPRTETEFIEILGCFCRTIYDVKYMMEMCPNLSGGLESVAIQLNVPRIGRNHEAGSDSLLTAKIFCTIKERYFRGNIRSMKDQHYGFGAPSFWPSSGELAAKR